MIEYIIGGIVITGLGYLAYHFREKVTLCINKVITKFNLDKNKLDVDDVIEVYDMIKDFISGGSDGVINATDALVLVRRLEQLIAMNRL